jgi:hypothetical protein
MAVEVSLAQPMASANVEAVTNLALGGKPLSALTARPSRADSAE